MTERIRRVRSTPRNFRQGETITLKVTVTAEVVDGLIKEENVEQWVRHALEHYHTFRAGHVGFGFIVGGIKPPTVQKQH